MSEENNTRTTGTCKRCGSEEWELEIMRTGPHYAKYLCSRCHAFIEWAPKPDAAKHKRTARHRQLPKKLGVDYCQMCLRHRDDLPGPGFLAGHHINPYAETQNSDPSNVWILCNSCHALVEHQRTYLGHYHADNSEQEATETNEGRNEPGRIIR